MGKAKPPDTRSCLSTHGCGQEMTLGCCRGQWLLWARQPMRGKPLLLREGSCFKWGYDLSHSLMRMGLGNVMASLCCSLSAQTSLLVEPLGLGLRKTNLAHMSQALWLADGRPSELGWSSHCKVKSHSQSLKFKGKDGRFVSRLKLYLLTLKNSLRTAFWCWKRRLWSLALVNMQEGRKS